MIRVLKSCSNWATLTMLVLSCSQDDFRCSQIFYRCFWYSQIFSGCSQCSQMLYRHSQMCSSCVQMFSDVFRSSQMFSRCRFPLCIKDPVFPMFLLKEVLWHFFPPTMLYREEGVSPDTMDPPTAPPMTYCLIGRNPRHMDPKKRIYGQIICCPFHLFSSSTFEVLIHFTSSKFIRLSRYT